MGHQRTNTNTVRYSRYGTWDALWAMPTQYNLLLYQDFQINKYFLGIFYKFRIISGPIFVHRQSIGHIFIETSIFIGKRLRLSTSFFGRRYVMSLILTLYRFNQFIFNFIIKRRHALELFSGSLRYVKRSFFTNVVATSDIIQYIDMCIPINDIHFDVSVQYVAFCMQHVLRLHKLYACFAQHWLFYLLSRMIQFLDFSKLSRVCTQRFNSVHSLQKKNIRNTFNTYTSYITMLSVRYSSLFVLLRSFGITRSEDLIASVHLRICVALLRYLSIIVYKYIQLYVRPVRININVLYKKQLFSIRTILSKYNSKLLWTSRIRKQLLHNTNIVYTNMHANINLLRRQYNTMSIPLVTHTLINYRVYCGRAERRVYVRVLSYLRTYIQHLRTVRTILDTSFYSTTVVAYGTYGYLKPIERYRRVNWEVDILYKILLLFLNRTSGSWEFTEMQRLVQHDRSNIRRRKNQVFHVHRVSYTNSRQKQFILRYLNVLYSYYNNIVHKNNAVTMPLFLARFGAKKYIPYVTLGALLYNKRGTALIRRGWQSIRHLDKRKQTIKNAVTHINAAYRHAFIFRHPRADAPFFKQIRSVGIAGAGYHLPTTKVNAFNAEPIVAKLSYIRIFMLLRNLRKIRSDIIKKRRDFNSNRQIALYTNRIFIKNKTKPVFTIKGTYRMLCIAMYLRRYLGQFLFKNRRCVYTATKKRAARFKPVVRHTNIRRAAEVLKNYSASSNTTRLLRKQHVYTKNNSYLKKNFAVDKQFAHFKEQRVHFSGSVFKHRRTRHVRTNVTKLRNNYMHFIASTAQGDVAHNTRGISRFGMFGFLAALLVRVRTLVRVQLRTIRNYLSISTGYYRFLFRRKQDMQYSILRKRLTYGSTPYLTKYNLFTNNNRLGMHLHKVEYIYWLSHGRYTQLIKNIRNVNSVTSIKRGIAGFYKSDIDLFYSFFSYIRKLRVSLFTDGTRLTSAFLFSFFYIRRLFLFCLSLIHKLVLSTLLVDNTNGLLLNICTIFMRTLYLYNNYTVCSAQLYKHRIFSFFLRKLALRLSYAWLSKYTRFLYSINIKRQRYIYYERLSTYTRYFKPHLLDYWGRPVNTLVAREELEDTHVFVEWTFIGLYYMLQWHKRIFYMFMRSVEQTLTVYLGPAVLLLFDVTYQRLRKYSRRKRKFTRTLPYIQSILLRRYRTRRRMSYLFSEIEHHASRIRIYRRFVWRYNRGSTSRLLQRRYRRFPVMQSAKIICEYIRDLIENNGYDARRSFKEIRRWQRYELREYRYLDMRAGGRGQLQHIIGDKMFPFDGIRILIAGPPKKARRKKRIHYHMWLRDQRMTRRMPLASVTYNIEFYKAQVLRRASEVGVRVWVLFKAARPRYTASTLR